MTTNIELSYQASVNRAFEIAMVQNTPVCIVSHIDGYFNNIKQKEYLKDTFKHYINFKVEPNKPYMFVEVQKNSADQLLTIKKRKLEPFDDVLERVEIGKKHLKDVDKTLDSVCEQFLKTYIERFDFDSADTDFVIDVAVSICALEGKNKIEVVHIAEAAQYANSYIDENIEAMDMQILLLKQEREKLLKIAT